MIWDIITGVLEKVKFYVEISKFCSLEISVLATILLHHHGNIRRQLRHA